MAGLGPKARLPAPMHHTYTCMTVSTACLHSHTSCQDLEKYQFCSSQDLTSEHEEWKQVTLSFVARAQAAWYLYSPYLPHFHVGHRARVEGHGSGGRWGPWNAQGTGQASIGHLSQPSNPSASLGCCKNKPPWRELRGGGGCLFQEQIQQHCRDFLTSTRWFIPCNFLPSKDPSRLRGIRKRFHFLECM